MGRKHQIAVAAALVGFSCLIQTWLIRRAVLPAQDAVDFVRFAQKIDEHGFLPALRAESQQPLFPVAVWLVHRAVDQVADPFPSSWALSAQLAAAAALVLAVVPVYFIALRLVGPRGATAGAIVFCVLPEIARLGPDGLSDSTHLLLFAMAFWTITIYLTGRSVWMVAAGMATAGALLTRVEVVVLPMALIVSMLAFQSQPARRLPWRQWGLAAGTFVLGFSLLFLPYLTAVGSLAPRAAVGRALGTFHPTTAPKLKPRPATATNNSCWQLPDGRRMSFAYKETTLSIRHRGFGPAIGTFFKELGDAFHVWPGFFALFGIWQLRRTPPRRLDRLVQIFFLLYSAAIIYHSAVEGYLAARHFVPVVAIAVGCAGYGLAETARLIAQCISTRSRQAVCDSKRLPASRLRIATTWAIAVAAASVCLLDQAEPLHAARSGHRQAGDWLADQPGSRGPVLDTRGFTGLYSGRPTYGSRDTWAALCDPALAYIVVERWEIEYASDRGRTLRLLLHAAADQAVEFGRSQPTGEPGWNVQVYRWHPQQYLAWLAARNHPRRGPSDAASDPRLCRRSGREL